MDSRDAQLCEHCDMVLVETADGALCCCRPGVRTRLYIAGPMTGLPEENYPAFRQASIDLRAMGYDVISPHTAAPISTPRTLPANRWLWFMRRTLPMLMRCDGIALLDGWNASDGARLENDVAVRLRGIPIQPLKTWIADAREARQRKAS